jgi:hypothetical protein
VQEVTITPGLPGTALVQWKPSPRAKNYRVRWKVAGSEAAPTDAGLFADCAANLTGLPSAVKITVYLTARNHAGETVPTLKEAWLDDAPASLPIHPTGS